MIRVAVVGAGHWGPNLIRNFHNRERSEVLWVVDRDPGRLGQVRGRFPEIQVEAYLAMQRGKCLSFHQLADGSSHP